MSWFVDRYACCDSKIAKELCVKTSLAEVFKPEYNELIQQGSIDPAKITLHDLVEDWFPQTKALVEHDGAQVLQEQYLTPGAEFYLGATVQGTADAILCARAKAAEAEATKPVAPMPSSAPGLELFAAHYTSLKSNFEREVCVSGWIEHFAEPTYNKLYPRGSSTRINLPQHIVLIHWRDMILGGLSSLDDPVSLYHAVAKIGQEKTMREFVNINLENRFFSRKTAENYAYFVGAEEPEAAKPVEKPVEVPKTAHDDRDASSVHVEGAPKGETNAASAGDETSSTTVVSDAPVMAVVSAGPSAVSDAPVVAVVSAGPSAVSDAPVVAVVSTVPTAVSDAPVVAVVSTVPTAVSDAPVVAVVPADACDAVTPAAAPLEGGGHAGDATTDAATGGAASSGAAERPRQRRGNGFRALLAAGKPLPKLNRKV